MTWEEQLLTPEWKERRQEILVRDNFKCQIGKCRAANHTLDVHHLAYIKPWKAWEYTDDWLLTLCRFHHQQYHSLVEITEKRLCLTLKTKGFMLGDLLALSTMIDSDMEFTESLLKILRAEQNG